MILHLQLCRKPQDTGLCQDLECTICLELPDTTKAASEHVFSCQQHHIICQGCLQHKILSCPVCRQDFLKAKPQRNYLAERLIRQQLEFQQKQGSYGMLEVPIQGNFTLSILQLWSGIATVFVKMWIKEKWKSLSLSFTPLPPNLSMQLMYWLLIRALLPCHPGTFR